MTNSHGAPESIIQYKNARFGALELQTADPDGEDERQLFSHYLWNAGLKLAELISHANEHDDKRWNVEGERVLELGAGVGLSGIVSTLAGAEEAIISDYPAKVVIENLRRNVARNVPTQLSQNCRVEGHAWGALDTPFALENKHRFTRILAADCYWLSGQHENLVLSMLHFLSLEPSARVFAIAGFHTGRARLVNFFEEADKHCLEPDEIYEEDDQGERREWLTERNNGYEDHTERKKWLVICRLKRKGA